MTVILYTDYIVCCFLQSICIVYSNVMYLIVLTILRVKTSGLNRGLRIYSCIRYYDHFMFYHRSNTIYSDSHSDTGDAQHFNTAKGTFLGPFLSHPHNKLERPFVIVGRLTPTIYMSYMRKRMPSS